MKKGPGGPFQWSWYASTIMLRHLHDGEVDVPG